MTAEAPDSTTDCRPGATRFPSRRVLLGGASAALLVGPALTAMAGPAQAGPRLDPSAGGGSVGRAEAFLRAMTDAYPEVNPGPRIPQSYADELGLFSTAFIYDIGARGVCGADRRAAHARAGPDDR